MRRRRGGTMGALALSLALLAGCGPHRPPEPTAPGDPTARGGSHTGARAALEELAGSLDLNVRAEALAGLVGSSAQPAGGDFGARGLWDPAPWVRRRVVRALVDRLPEPESQVLLEAFVDRDHVDPYSRGEAAIRLVRSGVPGIGDRLLPRISPLDQETSFATAPLALAATLGGRPEAEEPLRRALATEDLPIDLVFFDNLGRSGLTDLAPVLVSILDEVEPPLVLPISTALAWLDEPVGEGRLRAALGSAEVEEQLEAVDFILTLPTPLADSMLRHAGGGPDDPVREAARLGLVGLGIEEPGVASQVLQSEEVERRVAAFEALARRPRGAEVHQKEDRLQRKLLEAGLADPEVRIQIAALHLAAARGGRAEVDAAEALLGSEDERVRLAAALALLRIGG